MKQDFLFRVLFSGFFAKREADCQSVTGKQRMHAMALHPLKHPVTKNYIF